MMPSNSRLLSQTDIPMLLIRSGVVGVRQFWKLSSITKGLLKARDDSTSLGFGSLISGFDLASERAHLWEVLKQCLAFDNVMALRQVLAIRGVAARYPLLLRCALEKRAQKCVNFLIEVHPPFVCRDLTKDAVSVLTNESLEGLLRARIVRPDSWIELDDPGVRECSMQPLLTALIDARRFECAEMLLNAGARVDLVECYMESARSGALDFGRAPLLALVLQLAATTKSRCDVLERGKRELRMTQAGRESALLLLKRLANVSKDSGCLNWEGSVWMRIKRVCVCTAGSPCACEFGKAEPREATALGLACMAREPAAVRILLDAGAETSVGRGEGGDKPSLAMLTLGGGWLISRLEDGPSSEVLAALGGAGVDLNKTGKVVERERAKGHTPLSFSCFLGLQQCVEVLVEKGVDAKHTLRPSGPGQSHVHLPLIEALGRGGISSSSGWTGSVLTSVVKKLLEGGADPNAAAVTRSAAFRAGFTRKESRKVTPLQVLLRLFDLNALTSDETHEIAKSLIMAGARSDRPLSLQEGPSLVDPTFSQLSPLGIACAAHDVRLVRLLCRDGGADPNRWGEVLAREKRDAPLLLAVSQFPSRHPETRDETAAEIVEVLAEGGADLEITSVSSERMRHNLSALFLACANGLEKTAKVLLDKFASPNGKEGENYFREPPGFRLTRSPLLELIHPSLDTLLPDTEQLVVPPPFPVRSRILRLLLERGADPNQIGCTKVSGYFWTVTPLQLALYAEPAQSAVQSEEEGPDVMRAHNEQRVDLARLLIDHGARCPFSSAPTFQAMQAAFEASGYRMPVMKASPLFLACETQDIEFVRHVCEEGRADPNGEGQGREGTEQFLEWIQLGRLSQTVTDDRADPRKRVFHPLEFVLFELCKRDRNFEKRWKMVNALVEMGADVDRLSSVAEKGSWSERAVVLSGLMELEHARGHARGPLIKRVMELIAPGPVNTVLIEQNID